MNYSKQDFSGNPIFEFPTADGLTRFIPYSLDTIHEYIKAKQEMKELKQQTNNNSGAV